MRPSFSLIRFRSLRAVVCAFFAASTVLVMTSARAEAQVARSDGGAKTDAQPKVLVLFTVEGELDHYLFAQQALRWIATHAVAAGYRYTASNDWNLLSDAGLKDVQLVMWLNDQPHLPAQREAFRRFIERGGAWMGFHVAGFIKADEPWPWYRNDFLAAGFRGNNWPSLPARINVDDPTHPAVKGVPATFVSPITEWYSWKPSPRENPKVKVLLTLDPSNFPLGVKNMINGGDVPVAWANTHYRMVYINYGHGDRIFTSPVLTSVLDNGVRWLLARKP
ncbi:MAG TPA: ThuA domain-containing protein [Polyangia bacterium]